MNPDGMKAAIETMAEKQKGRFNELRKPTPTEVRQSKAQFVIHPQWGVPSFTLGCLYCNTGVELDYYGARLGEAMMRFCGRHRGCTPGCLPPEASPDKE